MTLTRMGRVEELLVEARALLARPYGWCKGTLHKTAPRNPEVLAHCALGAITYAKDPYSNGGRATRLLQAELPEGVCLVSDFNDRRSTKKKDVMALYDRAIARARSEGV